MIQRDMPATAPAMDQAAGLRRWAEQHRAQHASATQHPTADRTLVLFGPAHQASQVHLTLERWHRQGHAWVGHPARWCVAPVDNPCTDLHTLSRQQPRWGLWIDNDVDALHRAFVSLRQLRDHGGPSRIMALHQGFSPPGLLSHLREAAQSHLGIHLLLIEEVSD